MTDPTPIPAAAVEAGLEAWGITYSNSHGDLALSMQAAIVAALPHLASPAVDVAGLVERFRAGEPCSPPCKAMDARSGCICAEVADKLVAVATDLAVTRRERDHAREAYTQWAALYATAEAERDAMAERLRVVEAERDKAQDQADNLNQALDDALADLGDRMRDEE